MERKTRNILITLATLLAVAFLHSCMEEETEYAQLTIGTIRVIEGPEYYFEIDNGSTMYPGDTTNIHNYTPEEGQRAFVHFDLLDEKVPGYDYNAIVYRIENILTKDIYFMPPEKNDSIGDDPVNITDVWFTGDYINIQYQLYFDKSSDVKHTLSLVVNEETTASGSDTSTDYLPLEFRHNAHHEPQTDHGAGLVSFKIDNILPLMQGKKGVRIRVRTLYDGVQYKETLFRQPRI